MGCQAVNFVRVIAGCALLSACARPAPDDSRLPPLRSRLDRNTFAAQLRRPQPLTTATWDDYLPQFTPDGKAVIYVTTRKGNPDIYLKYLPGSGNTGDYPLTYHSARDTWPSLSPSGDRLVFASYRSDSRGDLYVLNLKSAERIPQKIRERLYERFGTALSEEGSPSRVAAYLDSKGALLRLTDERESEEEPAWSPKGDQIFFTRADKSGTDIFAVTLPEKNFSRITTGGGSMASPSPDGERLAFVRKGAIHVIDLTTRLSRQVTRGPFDSHPSWSDDGKQIFFSRFAYDTNGDGQVSVADNASIYSVTSDSTPLKEAALRRITSGERSDLFPSFLLGRVVFASTSMALASSSHLLAIGEFGPFQPYRNGQPLFRDAEALFAVALELATTDPRMAALAYEEIIRRWPEKKEAAYRLGVVHDSMGDRKSARAAWIAAIDGDDAGEWSGRARIALKRPDSPAPAFREIAERSSISGVQAEARLEEGRAWKRAGDEARAVQAWESVVTRTPNEHPEACAASLEKALLYRKFGDSKKSIDGIVALLRRYPKTEPCATRSAEEAIAMALHGVEKEADAEAVLRQLASTYGEVPILPALALNELGDRAALKKDPSSAEASFRSVLRQFPSEKKQGARARLALSRILIDRGEYREALELYYEAEAELPRNVPWRKEAQRRFIGNLLAKGRAEIAGGDFRMAVRTFRDLIAFKYDVPQAHRGLIQAYAGLGEITRAIEIYRTEKERYPEHYLPTYALGLAYTYVEPPARGFDLAQPFLEEAIAINGEAHFPHQTLGFVFEKREELLRQTGNLERAIDEYSVARSLSDPQDDFQNYADLTLNLGNGYFLFKDYSKAFETYTERKRYEAPFEPKAQQLVFTERFARAAFQVGKNDEAAKLTEDALNLVDILGREGVLSGREFTSHRAETRDLRALALGVSGHSAEAAKEFAAVAALNRELGNGSNEAKAMRNMAIQLFETPSLSQKEHEKGLSDARDTLEESLDLLDRHGVRTTKSRKTGSLLNLDLDVSLGGDTSEASKGFSEKGERELIYTFLGRIERDLGRDDDALATLDKKIAFLPSESSVLDAQRPAWFLKRSILQNQRGVLLTRLGRFSEAAGAFRNSLRDAHSVPHEMGEANGALALALLASISPRTIDESEVDRALADSITALTARTDPASLEAAARLVRVRLNLAPARTPAPSKEPLPTEAAIPALSSALRELRALHQRIVEQEKREPRLTATRCELELAHFRWTGRSPSREKGNLTLDSLDREVRGLGRDDLVTEFLALRVYLADPQTLDALMSQLQPALDWIGKRPVNRMRPALALFLPLFDRWLGLALASNSAEAAYNAAEWRARIELALAGGPMPDRASTPQAQEALEALAQLADDPKAWDEALSMLSEADRGIASLFRLDVVDSAELQDRLGSERAYVARLTHDKTVHYFFLHSAGFSISPTLPLIPESVRDLYVSGEALCPAQKICAKVNSGAHLFYALSHQSVFDRRLLMAKEGSAGDLPASKETLRWSTRSEFEKLRSTSDWFVAPSTFDPPSLFQSFVPLGAGFRIAAGERSTYESRLPSRLLLGSGITVAIVPNGAENRDFGLLSEWWARGGVATLFLSPPTVTTAAALSNLASARAGEAATKVGGTVWGALGLTPDEKTRLGEERLSDTIDRAASLYRAERWLEAVRVFEEALSVLDAMGSDESRDSILDAASTAAWKGGDLPRAVRLAEFLVAARRKHPSATLANALHFLGILYSRMEKFNPAVASLEESAALYRKYGSSKTKLAENLSERGVVVENAMRYRDALKLFDESLAIYRETGSTSGEGDQWRRIGRIYYLRLNDYAKAEEAFLRAAELFAKAKDVHNEDEARLEIGLVAEQRAQFDRAREIYKDVEARAERRGDRAVASKAALFTANTFWYQGDYFEAFRLQRKALEQGEKANDDRLRMLAHSTLGLVYWTLNQHDKAVEEQKLALSFSQKLASPIDEAAALSNTALILRDRGDLEGALRTFHEALRIDQTINTVWGISNDYRNIGITETKMGKPKEALNHLSEAVRLARSIGASVNETKALLNLAELHQTQGNLSEAESTFTRALERSRATRLREVEWRALLGLGRIASAHGKNDLAGKRLSEAIQVVEEMGASVKIEEFRNSFAGDKTSLYEEMILTILKNPGDRAAEAWSFAERARGRSFIDLLGNRSVVSANPTERALLDRDRRSREKLEELEQKVALAPDDKSRAEIVTTLHQARKEREDLLIEIRAARPELSSFVTVDVIAATELQQLLGPDAALVEYFLGKSEIFIWVITSGLVHLTRVPVERAEIEATVVAYSRLLQEQKPLVKESQKLNAWLIRPIEKHLAGKRAVGISPFGALHYLSFASLFDGERYLIDRYPLFYTPSASVLKFTLAGKPVDKRNVRILAIGNPDLGNRALDLPFAEKEVGAIAREFPDVDVLTGKTASEEAVVKNLGRYQIIHFASHGEFDPVSPLFSALRLAKTEKSTGELRVEDVFNLKMNADLVTLSACQTGLAKIEGGDELIGLNRSFLYAGTHSILSSLWRISDVATAVLIKRFYRNYATSSKAESLRAAQILVRGYYPHPAFWAALALTGDYR